MTFKIKFDYPLFIFTGSRLRRLHPGMHEGVLEGGPDAEAGLQVHPDLPEATRIRPVSQTLLIVGRILDLLELFGLITLTQ